MNFRKDFNYTNEAKASLIAFFHEKNKEEIDRLAAEMSIDAKEFFVNSINSLLGQMPTEMADTVITMNRQALYNLLYSSMVTGYLSKAVETKLDLDRVWSVNGESSSKTLTDQHLKSFPNFIDNEFNF